MTDDEQPDFATRQERAAAEQAGAIGGRASEPGGAGDEEPVDEATRPLREAGGGEAEGFELAEQDLIRNASHDDGTALPERDAFPAERESDRAGSDYGEADGEHHPDS